MKKKTIYAFLTVILLSPIFNTQAQRCPECEAALNKNATDVFESKTSKKYDEATSELFNHDYTFWSKYKSSDQHTTTADAAYSIYSAAFGNSAANTESQQKFEAMKTNYAKNHALSQDEQEYISSKVASKDAYTAWTACITGCHNGGGIFLEKEGNNDDEFIISLKNIPAGGVGLSTKVTNVIATNATFVNGDLKKDNTLAQWNTLLGVWKRIKRDEDVTISVSVTNLASPASITIPKYSESDKNNAIPLSSLLPVGTVVPYAGNNVPPGWLLCDGSVVNESQYQALSYAIGTYWGTGDHSRGSFNLPDMRGMFLRGVDDTAGNDPDKDGRTATNGGSSGNAVGSKQMDDYTKHHHDAPNNGTFVTYGSGNGYTSTAPGGKDINAGHSLPTTGDAGHNETRPKNVAVRFIIKF